MRAHWKQFLALFFAIAVAITSGVIVTTKFQAKVEMVVHEHTDECYGPSEISELVCEKEPHLHTDACFNDDVILEVIDGQVVETPTKGEELICGKEVHEHDMTCWQQKVDLICGKIAGQEYPVEVADEIFNLTIEYQFADWDNQVYTLMPQYTTHATVTSDGRLPGGAITTPIIEDAEYYYVVDDMAKDKQSGWNGTMDVTYQNFPEKDYLGYYPQQAIIRGYDTSVEANGTDATIKGDIITEIWYLRYPKEVLDDMLDEEDEEAADAELTINYVYRDENGQLVPIPEKESVTKNVAEGDYDFTEDKEIPGYKYEGGIPEEGVKLLKGDKKEVTLEFSKVADAKTGKLVVAIRPDGSTHNGDNYTMENGSKFFNNGNYVHPFWEEEVDFNQYFTSTDAITNTSGLANSQIKGVLTSALTGEIESRLAAGQLRPGQKLNVMLNGSYQDITFDPAIHEIIYTNLNWHGDVLHLDGVIKFKNEVNLAYDSNLPAGTNGKTLTTDRSPLTGATVDFTVRDGAAIGISKTSDGKEYEFVGWNTEKDGSGTPYAPGSTISVSTNTTLYAQWKEKAPEKTVVVEYIDDATGNVIKTDPNPESYTQEGKRTTIDGQEYKAVRVEKNEDETEIKVYLVKPVNLTIRYEGANVPDFPKDIPNAGFPGDEIDFGSYATDRDIDGVKYIYDGVVGDKVNATTKKVVLGDNGSVVTIKLKQYEEPENEEDKKAFEVIVNHWKITPNGLVLDDTTSNTHEGATVLYSKEIAGYTPIRNTTKEVIENNVPWAGALDVLESIPGWDTTKGMIISNANLSKDKVEMGVPAKLTQDFVWNVVYAPYGSDNTTTPTQPGNTPNQPGTTPSQPGTTPSQPTQQPGNITPVQQPGNTTPYQPANTTPNQTTPNAQPQAETPSLINTNGQTPAAPVQPVDATVNNADVPGETPADVATANEATAISAISEMIAIPVDTTGNNTTTSYIAQATPTGDVQLTQVDDIEAALADFNLGHVCNILYFLIIAGTIVVLANYFRMSKKHSKRVFELRGELGEDDPYKKN